MTISQLRLFLSIMEYGNFTKAAEHHYLTQPTVSKQIALLEEELGVQLFNRSKHYVNPTAAAVYFRDELIKIICQLDNLIEGLKDYSSGKKGTLQIGIYGMLDINRLLPDFIREFSEKYRDVSLTMQVFQSEKLIEMLKIGELDLIFIDSLTKQSISKAESIVINRGNPRIYYLASDRFGKKDKPTPEDFADGVFCFRNPDSPYHKALILALPFRIKKIKSMDSLETVFLCVESGTGVAILGPSQRMRSGKAFSSIELDMPDYQLGTDAVYMSENTNPVLKLFLESLHEYIASGRISND